jgi:peroxiredoxin
MMAAVVGLCFSTFASSADKVPRIGDKMPKFTLKDVEGNNHSLADYQGKIVVLDFMSKNCAWSLGHDVSLIDLAKLYADKGVVFLGIDSDRKNESPDIAAYAKDAGISFPILKDLRNKYANRVGASRTPEIFIIGADGKLAYHGAYDDRAEPNRNGKINYAARALDAILAGREAPPAKALGSGCPIDRALRPSAGSRPKLRLSPSAAQGS